jgi:hypothetical protein
MGERSATSEPHILCCARVIFCSDNGRKSSATTPKRIFQYFFIPYYFVEEFYHFIGIFIFSFFFFQEGLGVNWKKKNTLFY